MSSYAYFVQTCREEHRKKHPDETISFAAFSKKCSDRWKVMSEKEKQRFVDMATQDKSRFNAEMEGYVPPPGATGRGGKTRRKKDPNAPKRGLSAFLFFSNDERSGLRELNPSWTVGDVAKELGRRWNAMGDDEKAKYNEQAATDRERYQRDMEAYRNGAGDVGMDDDE